MDDSETKKVKEDARPEEVVYSSDKIGKKEKPEYFQRVKTKKPPFYKPWLEKLKAYRSDPKNKFHPLKGNGKYVTISVAALLLLALIFVVLWFTLWRGGATVTNPSVTEGATPGEINERAYEIYAEYADASYDEAVAYYKEQIEASKDDSERYVLTRDFAIFYAKTGDPTAGVELLDAYDPYGLSTFNRYTLYSAYRYLYKVLDDTEKSEEYEQRIISEGLEEKLDEEFENE